MHFLGVNLWAVLVSALATMVAGFLWYSPMLFAKPWTILMGYDQGDLCGSRHLGVVWGQDWLCCLAGIRDYGAADECVVYAAAVQTLLD